MEMPAQRAGLRSYRHARLPAANAVAAIVSSLISAAFSSTRDTGGGVFFEIDMEDAWVWDMYRPARFLKKVRVLTFRDVNLEEVEHPELRPPDAERR